GLLRRYGNRDSDNDVHDRRQQHIRSVHPIDGLHDRAGSESTGGVVGVAVIGPVRSRTGSADTWSLLRGTARERDERVRSTARQSCERDPGDEVCDRESEPDRCVLPVWQCECWADVPDLRDWTWRDEPEPDVAARGVAGRLPDRQRAGRAGDVYLRDEPESEPDLTRHRGDHRMPPEPG